MWLGMWGRIAEREGQMNAGIEVGSGVSGQDGQYGAGGWVEGPGRGDSLLGLRLADQTTAHPEHQKAPEEACTGQASLAKSNMHIPLKP